MRMLKAVLVTFFAFISTLSLSTQTATPNNVVPAKPAAANKVDVSDDYFGTKVTDSYRWMEAGQQDAKFMAYLKSQNDYTRATLDSLKGHQKLLQRIRELDNGAPAIWGWQRGGTSIFYLEAAPGTKTPSLMVRYADGQSRKLLDPASMEQDGSHAAIDYFAPSWDGRYVIAGASLGGSENSVIHVIESATGKMLPDSITRTQYGFPTWSNDSRSFYYSRLQQLSADAPPSAVYENQRVYLHVLGNDVEKDALIFGPGVSPAVDVPKAGLVAAGTIPGSNYAFAYHTAGTSAYPGLYFAPSASVTHPDIPWHEVVSPNDMLSVSVDSSIAIFGSTLYLLIEKDSPNRKLVAVDLAHPDVAKAQVLIPSGDKLLTGIYATADGLYLTSKHGVTFELQRAAYGPKLEWQPISMPVAGTISNIDANVLLPGVVFRLESWTESDQVFAYDPATKQVSNTQLLQKDPADFSSIEVREVDATSADGTKVPLSVLCRKGLVLDGSHPTLYSGYGAYGISFDPNFANTRLAWLERGGVYAVVHPRGGGEFGEAWHTAGQKQTKQHTIDDMIAAAQYLIQQHYSSPQHLAVMGTSAGGIAVGGAIVQHPELFVAAIDNVGATDLLRFQLTQGGAANIPEFGDVNDRDGFKYLYAVSPYAHVVDGTKYPAVLGITGTNDPRVPTWMVAKMIARLQAATASGRPILLRVDSDEGHGLGASRPERERMIADYMSFILWQSGDPAFQPNTHVTGK